MKLVVGLGNPGRKYRDTRHNLGYVVAAQLAGKYATGPVKTKFQGECAEAIVEGQKALLLTPTTYMNQSCASVLAARDFYKISAEDLLVVCDDLHLPPGRLRVRVGGSAGGQKGLEDIIRRLATDEFPRLRIGIGSPPEDWDWADFVLSKFQPEEIPLMEQAMTRAVEAVAVWARDGIQTCMNQFNA